MSAVTRPRPQQVGRFYLLLTAGLAAWVVVLALRLPTHHVAAHYALAWTGFDVALAVAMAATGLLAVRRRPAVVLPATTTGALLVADAWFDVTTSSGGGLLAAVAMAALVELPLAVLSFVVAHRALRRATR